MAFCYLTLPIFLHYRYLMNTLIYHIFHMWSLNYIYITVTETNFKTENPVIIFFYEENDWSNKISNEKFLRLKFFETFQKFFLQPL